VARDNYGSHEGFNQRALARKEHLLEWASDKVIAVTARVFQSPVLFGLLFLVSLAAVLNMQDHEDKKE
jgi:hypothetical protein